MPEVNEIRGQAILLGGGERGEGAFFKERLTMGVRFCASTFYQVITE